METKTRVIVDYVECKEGDRTVETPISAMLDTYSTDSDGDEVLVSSKRLTLSEMTSIIADRSPTETIDWTGETRSFDGLLIDKYGTREIYEIGPR